MIEFFNPFVNPSPANLLYALASCVMFHQKSASQSNKIRGAALFQLMKIQNILSQKIQARDLYARDDTVDQKLFLYVRATSTVRSSLQCVINSWLSTGFTSKIALSNEQGGYDLMTYCSKHIIQAFNNKVGWIFFSFGGFFQGIKKSCVGNPLTVGIMTS